MRRTLIAVLMLAAVTATARVIHWPTVLVNEEPEAAGSSWPSGCVLAMPFSAADWLNDESGLNNDGTANGNAAYINKGIASGAFTNDAGSSYIQCGSNANMNISGALTVGCWFKTSGKAAGENAAYMVSRDEYTVSKRNWMLYMADTGVILWDAFNGVNYYTAITVSAYNDTKWHLAVGVFDPSLTSTERMRIYIDGNAELRTAAGPASINTTAVNLTLGGAPVRGDVNFKGYLDNVFVKSGAMTAAEILTLYTTGGIGGL